MLKVVLEFFLVECFEPVRTCTGVAFKNLHDKPFFGTHGECSFRYGVNSQSGGARADRERITRVGPQYLASARNARGLLQDVVAGVVGRATSRSGVFSKILAFNRGRPGGTSGNCCGGQPEIAGHLVHLEVEIPIL